MTSIPPAEIAYVNGNGSSAARARCTLSRVAIWPPRITWSFGRTTAVAPSDALVDVEWINPADGMIGLRLCNSDGQEYGVDLSLPPALVEAAVESLKPGMTLAEIGKLEAANPAAAVQEAATDAAMELAIAVPSTVEP